MALLTQPRSGGPFRSMHLLLIPYQVLKTIQKHKQT